MGPVVVMKEGYVPVEIGVNPLGQSQIRVRLTPERIRGNEVTVEGSVVYRDACFGAPAVPVGPLGENTDMRVELTAPGGFSKASQTNVRGHFRITGVPAGNYYIKLHTNQSQAYYSGGRLQAMEINVSPGMLGRSYDYGQLCVDNERPRIHLAMGSASRMATREAAAGISVSAYDPDGDDVGISTENLMISGVAANYIAITAADVHGGWSKTIVRADQP
jgi:hypothetical protein